MYFASRYVMMLCVGLMVYGSIVSAQAATINNGTGNTDAVDPLYFGSKDKQVTPAPSSVPISSAPMPTASVNPLMMSVPPLLPTESAMTPPNMSCVPIGGPAVSIIPISLPKVAVGPQKVLPVPTQGIQPNPLVVAPVVPFNNPLEKKLTPAAQSVPLSLPTTSLPSTVAAPKVDIGLSWQGSLMFSDVDIQQINQAIQVLSDNINGNVKKVVTINTASVPAQKAVVEYPTTAPIFYLNSIIYFSLDSWAIWINGNKVSAPKQQVDASLQLVSVSAKEVTFRWYPRYLDHISPNWSKQLQANEDGSYSNATRTINLSASKDMLTFTLHPNQVFAVYDMDIFEGNGIQTTLPASEVKNTNKDNTPSPGSEDTLGQNKL